jgi:hypothetical protein
MCFGGYRFFFSLGFLALVSCANAQQPWNVDAPSTAREGWYTIRLAYLSSETPTRRVQSTPRLQVSHGIGPQTELMARVTHLSVIRNQSLEQGLGDTVLGIKHRFVESGPDHVGLSYQISLPTGDQAKGLGSDQLEHQVLFLAQRRLNSRETVLVNLGERLTGRDPGSPSIMYGVLYKNQVDSRTTLGVQLHGNRPFKAQVRDDLAWGVGAIYRFAPDRSALLHAGRSLKGRSNLNLYIGIQMGIPGR